MANERVLIVEDDRSTLRMLAESVEAAGYRANVERTAAAGVASARAQRPDLIILDLVLPDRSGLEVCRELRGSAATDGVPIIMVTALGEPADKVSGLDLGADDYMVKPVDIPELLARIRALLRRHQSGAGDGATAITVDGFVIQPERLSVGRNGSEAVQLTALEFKLLYQLASRPDETFSRHQLQTLVWGQEHSNTERAVDVLVNRLRGKLDALPEGGSIVRTVRGVGYRFRG